MQKKIYVILIGYILILCLLGTGLAIKRYMESLPFINDAVLMEIISNTETEDLLTEKSNKDETVGAEQHEGEKIEVEKTAGESNYWESYYQESQNGTEGDALTRFEEKITPADKIKILTIVKKSLTSEDVKYIVSLSKGGFTAEDQKEIKALLNRKLGDKERQELKALILKYFSLLSPSNTK